jgi:hypothetical protein
MKTMFVRTLLSVVILAGLVFGLSCHRTGGEANKNKNISEPMVKDAIKTRVREFVYPLPTSYEAIKMLNKIDAPYILGICNPHSNAEKYFTEKSKALNLGIYGADLSYASTYQMKQETMFYLDAEKKLSDEIGLSGLINEQLLKDVEVNIDNREKLIDIITNTFYDTYDGLNQNGRGNLSLLIIAGSWVEALYISTHISANSYQNYDIVKIIHDQKGSIDKMYELFEPNKDDAYVKEIMQDLQPLKNLYDALSESFTEAQVLAVTKEVELLRTKIVS